MSGHGHGGSAAAEHKGRLTAVLAITVAILAAEVVGALVSGSLTLLADAGHMLTDAGGIGLSLLAIHFGQRSPSQARTSATCGWRSWPPRPTRCCCSRSGSSSSPKPSGG
jgi:Co/Zn/Cd efflux system component